MSFRERSLWVTFVLLLGLYGVYFLRIAAQVLDAGRPAEQSVASLAGWLMVLVVFEVIIHIVLAIRSPREARAPADERERQIELLATRRAYFVLLVGAFLTFGALVAGADAGIAVHGVLLSIWLAELVRYGGQLVLYRTAI
jgi:Ca2+/Na+ antiporter